MPHQYLKFQRFCDIMTVQKSTTQKVQEKVQVPHGICVGISPNEKRATPSGIALVIIRYRWDFNGLGFSRSISSAGPGMLCRVLLRL